LLETIPASKPVPPPPPEDEDEDDVLGVQPARTMTAKRQQRAVVEEDMGGP
jgi:hypothetical protein